MSLPTIYQDLKRAYVGSLGCDVPTRYQSCFVAWGGSAEVQYIYGRWARELPAEGRVLVVGVVGGRDFFLMKSLGFDVVGLDIAPQPEIAPVVTGNVEEELPFDEAEFDLVIISEVLEHLRNDVAALENIARVLKPAGKLIVSLPYYNDYSDGHVRIHSPRSAERLLAMGGFRIDDQVERPGLFRPGWLNPLQHALCLASWLVKRKTTYGFTNRLIGAWDWTLGHNLGLRAWRKRSKGFGAYFLCSRAAHVDAAELNRSIYSTGGETSGDGPEGSVRPSRAERQSA